MALMLPDVLRGTGAFNMRSSVFYLYVCKFIIAAGTGHINVEGE